MPITQELLDQVSTFLDKKCGGKGKDDKRRRKAADKLFGKFPALKVGDPEFILERLRLSESAGFFSKTRLIAKIGEAQVLVNSDGIPMAWAIVRQGGPVSTADVEKFANIVKGGVDPATRADFHDSDSFYYIPLELVEDLSTPKVLKSASSVIDFSTDLAKSMVDPKAFAQDPSILELNSVPSEELLIIRGALVDMIDHESSDDMIAKTKKAHELVANELRERGVMPGMVHGDTEKAVWSTAFVNTLPDSSFLFIESGGRKDEEGKTVPRALRHFPVKDQNGAIDLPHLRNAIARIPQSKIPGMTADDKQRLQERARRMLADAQKGTAEKSADIAHTVRIVKSAVGVDIQEKEERFIFGVVLVPNEPDSQGDIYTAEEVTKAAHAYMETASGTFKLMHAGNPIEGLKVLESYVTKIEETHNEETFPVGTWLMAARVMDNMLWDQIKKGVFTGFSIGGSAIRETLQ